MRRDGGECCPSFSELHCFNLSRIVDENCCNRIVGGGVQGLGFRHRGGWRLSRGVGVTVCVECFFFGPSLYGAHSVCATRAALSGHPPVPFDPLDFQADDVTCLRLSSS